ncbi:MAG: 3-oxoacyl-ACP synthase [Bacteroidales bacterium]|nr:3-oxoacyl-ACP synthase [Bacteroidales bacterium]
MIYALADNTITPGGLKAGQTVPCLPYPVCASLMEGSYEDLVCRSASASLADAGVDPSRSDVVLILSTTKGEIGVSPGESAVRIASRLGVKTCPVTVCNACASGASAIILALRLLEAGEYSYAIVVGADVPGRFIFSGFGALQSLSPELCRPFDIERNGLNLGTAVASVVFGREPSANTLFTVLSGASRNDAYHISAPSPKGEGLKQAAEAALSAAGVLPEELALVNAHGTATLFNDQMESVAFERAGLGNVPVNALKGYFGHTLGAAGLLETVVSARELREGRIPGTIGYKEHGVSGKIRVVKESEAAKGKTFLKTVSGFGGCNAAVVVTMDDRFFGGCYPPQNDSSSHSERAFCHSERAFCHSERSEESPTLSKKAHVQIVPGSIGLNEIYRQSGVQWPKFFKMDPLSKLGFLAAEKLLEGATKDSSRAVILFNRTSSLHTDREYLQTLSSPEGFFPSPSLFVYTLPNIVTGEIAIRHGLHGETSFYILPEKNEELMWRIVAASMQDSGLGSAVCGWLDYEDEGHYEADFYLIEKN